MRQIVESVYEIEGLRAARVYLLTSDEGLTLVDGGMSGDADKIVAQMEEAGFALADLRAIVVTHAHSDHIGSVAELARRSGALVFAHQDEVPYLEQTEPMPFSSTLPRLMMGLSNMLFKPERCQVDKVVQDGDVIAALGGLQVIHVPGHTPGSIALYQPQRKILFCGDSVFPRRVFSVDAEQAQASAQKLAALPVEVACFGHREPILEGAGEKMRAEVG